MENCIASFNEQSLNSGSDWLRYEPKVNAPGTIFNPEFKGRWAKYLEALEDAESPMR
jgi:hypothetical protein